MARAGPHLQVRGSHKVAAIQRLAQLQQLGGHALADLACAAGAGRGRMHSARQPGTVRGRRAAAPWRRAHRPALRQGGSGAGKRASQRTRQRGAAPQWEAHNRCTPALCPPKQRPHGSSEVRRQRSATCVCGRLLPAARGNGRAAAGQGRAGPAAGPGPVRRTFVQPPEQSSQLLAAILHLPLLARVPTGPRLAYLRGSGEGARGITEGRGGRRAALRCARGLRVGAT